MLAQRETAKGENKEWGFMRSQSTFTFPCLGLTEALLIHILYIPA